MSPWLWHIEGTCHHRGITYGAHGYGALRGHITIRGHPLSPWLRHREGHNEPMAAAQQGHITMGGHPLSPWLWHREGAQ